MKKIILVVMVCIAVMTIGCIDEFENEKISTPIIVPSIIPPITVPTLVPMETIVSDTVSTVDKEEFIDKYTKAKEVFKYDSYEPELKANESRNLAHLYYDKGQLSEASDKYHEAGEFYLKAKEQNLEAKLLFKQIYEIAPTEYYKELCELYIVAAQSDAKTLEYMSSAMKHMEKVCDYYKKEDYEAGDREIEDQERDIIRYNIEVETFNNLSNKIDEMEGW